jgi:hypothetical protein
MICLIDDNLNLLREREYGLDYIQNGEFKDILTSIEVLSNSIFIDYNYDAFLIHTTTYDSDTSGSSIPGQNVIVNRIIEHLMNNLPSKPAVFFSGGMPEVAEFDYNEDPNRIYQIKKSTFYTRLKPFLEHYRLLNQIELRILAYGKNYKYTELIKHSQPLLKYLREIKGVKIDQNEYLVTLLHSFFSVSEIPGAFKDFLNNSKEHSLNDLINTIQRINESFITHGRNIYGWPKQ